MSDIRNQERIRTFFGKSAAEMLFLNFQRKLQSVSSQENLQEERVSLFDGKHGPEQSAAQSANFDERRKE